MSSHTSQSIARTVEGRLVGEADLALERLAMIGEASPGSLTFIGEAKYAKAWAQSEASAALVSEGIELEPGDGRALIFVKNADLAMATVLKQFAPPTDEPEVGVHATAVVHADAVLGEGVSIGAGCVIGPRARVGAGSVLHSHVTLMGDAVVGAGCVLWPGVVIRERCTTGDRCVLEPHVVLGADGFGYRQDDSAGVPRIVKIPHIGHVELGDEVELGAGTTVDRGKFTATTIGSGTKIDNQVQVGHNCRIGRLVVISGCGAIAGSVVIGDGTMIGGGAIISDHVTIGRQCRIAGGAAVINDVPDGETWAGYPAKPAKTTFREEMAVRQLPDLLKKVKKLIPSDKI